MCLDIYLYIFIGSLTLCRSAAATVVCALINKARKSSRVNLITTDSDCVTSRIVAVYCDCKTNRIYISYSKYDVSAHSRDFYVDHLRFGQ